MNICYFQLKEIIYPLQVAFSASTKTQMTHKKGGTATEKELTQLSFP